MLRPIQAKLYALCLLVFITHAPRLVAQQTVSSEESLSREIAENWNSFQAQAKALTPEARIAAVDQWQKTQQPKLEALKQKRIQSARTAPTKTSPLSLSSPAPVTELDKINADIEKEFQPILAAKLAPEEHIRRVDEAEKQIITLQRQRLILLHASPQSRLDTARQGTGKLFESSSHEGRLQKIFREIAEQTAAMSPEERTKAVDARQEDIATLERQIQHSRRAPSPNTAPARLPAFTTPNTP